MMNDVNDCEQYLFSVSDENWLNFCLFFNECVQKYDAIDEELHYFRLKLNRAPATLAKMIKTIEKDKSSWILCTIWETRYHMTGENGEFNLKFVSSNSTNNIFEAVYDKNGILLTEKNVLKIWGHITTQEQKQIIPYIINLMLIHIFYMEIGIVKKCAVREYPKSWIVRYQAT